MHLAFITAGGAGMFCGSCMHDNALTRALMGLGVEVSLLPMYTPIRVDERNVSEQRVFLGGINLYLDVMSPVWRRMPRFVRRLVDRPGFIRFATRFGVSNDARELGELTLANLRGTDGVQKAAVEELADYVATLRPDVVIYSNALLAGSLRAIRKRFSGPAVCLLQGDDIFLKDLVEPYRSQALSLLKERAGEFDAFLAHSRYYAEFMSEYAGLPREKMHVVPLGIDLEGHAGEVKRQLGSPPVIGYFGRICPEKGLHLLVDAVERLRATRPDVQLRVGGYLGARDAAYYAGIAERTESWGEGFASIGSPATHAEKVAFLRSLDLFSLPTTYREPKGLSVLEAMANGVPVVQPAHGAFPEMLERTGGGLLFEPENAADLAAKLDHLLADDARRVSLAEAGRRAVHGNLGTDPTARMTLDMLSSLRRA